MKRQLTVYGLVLMAATLLCAQNVIPMVPVRSGNTSGKPWVPFSEFLIEAEAGNSQAQFNVADAYSKGVGVAKDEAEALRWCLQSANQGFAPAQNRIGYMYENGIGVPKDYTQAIRWFSNAAEQKLPAAQYNLGYMYEEGEGVNIDYLRAIDLYRQAAAAGCAAAQNGLGMAYIRGRGVPMNATEAFNLFHLAAEQGNPEAQHNLGSMYLEGKGTTRNYPEALKWFTEAAKQGVREEYRGPHDAQGRSLFDGGFARMDSMGIGLDATNNCALIDASGEPSARIFAIGPLTRAAFWEIVAIPDIRDQCHRLAEHICNQLHTA